MERSHTEKHEPMVLADAIMSALCMIFVFIMERFIDLISYALIAIFGTVLLLIWAVALPIRLLLRKLKVVRKETIDCRQDSVSDDTITSLLDVPIVEGGFNIDVLVLSMLKKLLPRLNANSILEKLYNILI